MFVIDSSGDSGSLLLEQQKRLTLLLSAALVQLQRRVRRLRLRLAALQYGHVVSTRHNFRDWQDLDVFQSRLTSMSGSGRHGAPQVVDALGNATRLFARETAGGSLRVLLLMLDGRERPGVATWAAAEAQRHDIRLFVIRTAPPPPPSDGASGEGLQYNLADGRLQEQLLQQLVSDAHSLTTGTPALLHLLDNRLSNININPCPAMLI